MSVQKLRAVKFLNASGAVLLCLMSMSCGRSARHDGSTEYKSKVSRLNCENNLRNLAIGLENYRKYSGGVLKRLPDKEGAAVWRTLLDSGYVGVDALVCPVSKKPYRGPLGRDWQERLGVSDPIGMCESCGNALLKSYLVENHTPGSSDFQFALRSTSN